MNKQQLSLIVGLFSVLLLVLTNPSLDEHKSAIKNKFMEAAQSSLLDKATSGKGLESLGMMLGATLAENMINNMVSRDNYLLFSLTKITFKGEGKVIGVGLLGNVFLTKKVNDLKM